MSGSTTLTFCPKHRVQHHYYGGSRIALCDECERDEQLDRIEEKLDQLLGRPRTDPRLAFIG